MTAGTADDDGRGRSGEEPLVLFAGRETRQGWQLCRVCSWIAVHRAAVQLEAVAVDREDEEDLL